MTPSVGIRALKQNPQRLIEQVLTSGESVEITSYGVPTGVRIVPDVPGPRRWVSASALADVTPLTAEQAASWKSDVDAISGQVDDPWGSE